MTITTFVSHSKLFFNKSTFQRSTNFKSESKPVIVSTLRQPKRPHKPEFQVSRRDALKAAVGVLGGLAATLFDTKPASAVCGEPDPFYAHFLDWEEALASGPDGRQIHYRLIGTLKKEEKAKKYPVVYIGDAGVGLASGETLELLGNSDRRILFVDFLGVGESDKLRLPISGLGRTDAVTTACDEILAALRDSRIISKPNKNKTRTVQPVHVVAAGFGIDIAAELLKRVTSETNALASELRIASFSAEGWAPLPIKRDQDINFSVLGGDRACMAEAAEQGNLDISQKFYSNSSAAKQGNFDSALQTISDTVPTLMLKTSDTKPFGEKLRGKFYTESTIEGSGRLAHLSNTEACLHALDDFFSKAEDSNPKA